MARVEDHQWIGDMGAQEPMYVFGRMKQRTVGATLAADVAFSPTLTLQFFAQLFVSAGSFRDFRRIADPEAARYADRFADLDGLPETQDSPDFNFRQLRTNTVLRWEYRSGSTLYLVWSQGRDAVVADGVFRPASDLRSLFSARSNDALMLKMSYWWTP
jgi:hypothetical protein